METRKHYKFGFYVQHIFESYENLACAIIDGVITVQEFIDEYQAIKSSCKKRKWSQAQQNDFEIFKYRLLCLVCKENELEFIKFIVENENINWFSQLLGYKCPFYFAVRYVTKQVFDYIIIDVKKQPNWNAEILKPLNDYQKSNYLLTAFSKQKDLSIFYELFKLGFSVKDIDEEEYDGTSYYFFFNKNRDNVVEFVMFFLTNGYSPNNVYEFVSKERNLPEICIQLCLLYGATIDKKFTVDIIDFGVNYDFNLIVNWPIYSLIYCLEKRNFSSVLNSDNIIEFSENQQLYYAEEIKCADDYLRYKSSESDEDDDESITSDYNFLVLDESENES